MKWQYLSSSVRVTNNNFSHLLFLSAKAAEILQVQYVPELYIRRSDHLEGISIGVEDPLIILSSDAVEKLSNQELLFVLGREMAHIEHQHTLYKEIGLIFPELIEAFSVVTLGLSSILSAGLKYALYNWDMTSELTADRGGLLACQDWQTCVSFLAKLAGWPQNYWSSINLAEFQDQARKFKHAQSSFDKIVNYMLGDNSFGIVRLKELIDWTDAGDYDALILKSKAFDKN